VIIADEPTSALDVVVQRQVMVTLARVQQDLGAAVILIGHDMGLMAQFVDRLGVMYGATSSVKRRRGFFGYIRLEPLPRCSSRQLSLPQNNVHCRWK